MSFLPTLVAGDVIESSAVSSRCCLGKCHSVGCVVVVVPVVSVLVLAVGNSGSVSVEHVDGMVQIVGAFVDSHCTLVAWFLAQLHGHVKAGCMQAVVALEVQAGSLTQIFGVVFIACHQIAILVTKLEACRCCFHGFFHVNLSKSVFQWVLACSVALGKLHCWFIVFLLDGEVILDDLGHSSDAALGGLMVATDFLDDLEGCHHVVFDDLPIVSSFQFVLH